MARAPYERQLFRVGDHVYRWSDVVEHARATGAWDEVADRVRAGLAALAELGTPPPEELEAAARDDRYERNLLAADDLDAWLVRRGLTVADWHAYLERALAGAAFTGSPAPQPVPDDLTWAEGICAGRLEDLAVDLAQLAAVETDLDEFRRDAATEEAIAREIQASRLEWQRVGYDVLRLDSEDAAAEAAACVRDDGLPLTEVARRAGVAVDERDGFLDEAEPELARQLIAARPGDVVGPIETSGVFLLAQLRTRTAPTATDDAVRARAAQAVADRAVSRLVDERVVWLDA
jgi:hypothetical protein